MQETIRQQLVYPKKIKQINEAKHQLNVILAWMNVFKHYGVANRGPNRKSSEGFYNEPAKFQIYYFSAFHFVTFIFVTFHLVYSNL